MARLLARLDAEDGAEQLTGWLSVLSECEVAAERHHSTRPADHVESLRLQLDACKADVMALLARIEDGEQLDDAETVELLEFLQGEIAALKGRILRARAPRVGGATKSRVVRGET